MKLCECGCGRQAPLARANNAARGWRKGQPVRFIAGHQARKHPRYHEAGWRRGA